MPEKNNKKHTKFAYFKQFLKTKNNLLNSKYLNKNMTTTPNQSIEFTAHAVATFCLENNVKADQFNSLFRYYLVDVLRKTKPDTSIIQIAVRTGIDRRLIGNIGKVTKQSKEMLILAYLKTYCEKENTVHIKKKGVYNSFDYFCKLGACGNLTTNAIADELLRLGYLENKGHKYKVILNSKIK